MCRRVADTRVFRGNVWVRRNQATLSIGEWAEVQTPLWQLPTAIPRGFFVAESFLVVKNPVCLLVVKA
jgi:hypothetical protein